MTRKTFITAVGCALLTISLLGCGGSNKLQSITLGIGGSSGLFNLQGIGGTLQLKATGEYSSTKTKDLTNLVTYAVVPDGDSIDGLGNLTPLNSPPMTVTMSPTGLMTAVDPAVCTWVNLQPDPDKDPSWALTGSYKVTATFQGVTSQPVFVGVASAAGPGTGECGPS